jgi:hypothetical protein
VHDYSKIDSDATRYKALKSKRIFWGGVTGVIHFHRPLRNHHRLPSHNITLLFSNISSTFALYHHHIFPFTESSSWAASYFILWRGYIRELSIHYGYLGPTVSTRVWGPLAIFASVSHVLARNGLALILRPISFMCFISSADTPI